MDYNNLYKCCHENCNVRFPFRGYPVALCDNHKGMCLFCENMSDEMNSLVCTQCKNTVDKDKKVALESCINKNDNEPEKHSDQNNIDKLIDLTNNNSDDLFTTLKKKILVKITNASEKHNNHQYVDGLNVLSGDFVETGSCVSGGLYFTDIGHMHEFLDYGVNVRIVELPFSDNDFKCVADGENKWRANKIILREKYALYHLETYIFLEEKGFCLRRYRKNVFRHAVKNNYLGILSYLTNVFPIDNFDNTHALHIAIANNHFNIVCFLVEKNKGMDDFYAFIANGIVCACCFGKMNIVEFLITSMNKDNVEHSTWREDCLYRGIEAARVRKYNEIVQYLENYWIEYMRVKESRPKTFNSLSDFISPDETENCRVGKPAPTTLDDSNTFMFGYRMYDSDYDSDDD